MFNLVRSDTAEAFRSVTPAHKQPHRVKAFAILFLYLTKLKNDVTIFKFQRGALLALLNAPFHECDPLFYLRR